MRTGHVVLAVSVVALALVACGGAEIGEECKEEGQADKECVDGAVCGKTKGGTLTCQKICTNPAECGANEECNGVPNSSSLKGCRPK